MNEKEALGRMAAYCSGAERCASDVRKKLDAAGLAAPAADRILATLMREGFIDEARFAGSFVNDKVYFNHWGRIKIACELRRKNIPDDVCRDAIAGIDSTDYLSMLLSVLEKKKRTTKGKDDRDVFTKLMRFAAGRGFEHRETVYCLHRLFQAVDRDWYDDTE
jgi:regulatory protein